MIFLEIKTELVLRTISEKIDDCLGFDIKTLDNLELVSELEKSLEKFFYYVQVDCIVGYCGTAWDTILGQWIGQKATDGLAVLGTIRLCYRL